METARLLLRPSDRDDAHQAFRISSDWEVTRNLSAAAFPPVLSDLETWFDEHPREWTEGKAYRFAVLHRGAMIGLADLDRVSDTEAELGYWLGVTWWGHGYATEAAGALIQFAWGALGLARLKAGHAADNPASGRLLVKLGFQCITETEVYSRPRDCKIRALKYALDRN
ncbi:MAG: GNAT family N-acetyltransferase [Rhodospirillaceae bacterium]|nr:GNAT family N-acetyltransferase [Rhodospirillaceae bacterium]